MAIRALQYFNKDAWKEFCRKPSWHFHATILGISLALIGCKGYLNARDGSLWSALKHAVESRTQAPQSIEGMFSEELRLAVLEHIQKGNPVAPGGFVYSSEGTLHLYRIDSRKAQQVAQENDTIKGVIAQYCGTLEQCGHEHILAIVKQPLVKERIRYMNMSEENYRNIVSVLERLEGISLDSWRSGKDARAREALQSSRIIASGMLHTFTEEPLPHSYAPLEDLIAAGIHRPQGEYVGTWEMATGVNEAAWQQSSEDHHHLVIFERNNNVLVRDFYQGQEVATYELRTDGTRIRR